ncbi:hypothetical protein CMI37_11590 [Candidatus Pacearchaeota archaeon]|nr:hypothetical protein [Candidatus Pacearchaeota archaeon]|tara:strand:- start:6288 stop:6770 length:483 start_codon:yes stop_codon:yes gene_type:complete
MFYKSTRIGKNGKPFTLFKIKTMKDGDGPSSTSADDPRITKVGHWLRKYKLDELAQLWNIIKRDMNFVGPRPEVPEVIDLMTDQEKRVILSVRPGLTDLASLWNSNEEEVLKGSQDPHQDYLNIIWPTKKKLQIEYINKRSIWLDLKIIIKTILKIFVRR